LARSDGKFVLSTVDNPRVPGGIKKNTDFFLFFLGPVNCTITSFFLVLKNLLKLFLS
jgi:hypothetical protein